MLAEWCRTGLVGFSVGGFLSPLITNQGFHNHLVGGSRLEGVVEFAVGGVRVFAEVPDQASLF
jgi:hypothetical protein